MLEYKFYNQGQPSTLTFPADEAEAAARFLNELQVPASAKKPKKSTKKTAKKTKKSGKKGGSATSGMPKGVSLCPTLKKKTGEPEDAAKKDAARKVQKKTSKKPTRKKTKRCAKCQQPGHLFAACTRAVACAVCAGGHTSAECPLLAPCAPSQATLPLPGTAQDHVLVPVS